MARRSWHDPRCPAARAALITLLTAELAAADSTRQFAELVVVLAAAAWDRDRNNKTVDELTVALSRAAAELDLCQY